jgi:putative ABC transport system permease protein
MFHNYFSATLRNLTRNGPYAGVTIAGLAIGFCMAILIGLYVRHELTYDQFVPGYERVFLVNRVASGGDVGPTPVDTDSTAAPLADALKLQFPGIEYAARLEHGGLPPTVRHGEIKVSEGDFNWADPDFFKIMPLPTVAGNLATALEPPDGLVITRSAARKFFGTDAPIGGQVLVDGHPMRVNAVIEDLPSNTHLAGDFFASSKAPSSFMGQYGDGGWFSNSFLTYVRLKPGASASAIDAALPGYVASHIIPILNRIAPNEHLSMTLRLKPLAAIHLEPALGDSKPGVDVKVIAGLAVIGVLIVAVAGINFVTLMTARATRRAVEVGVRKAAGADRRDLMVQFIGEALVYVLLALVLAVALAEALLPVVNAALQRKMAFNYLSDPTLIVTMVVVTVFTGLAAGVYPALVLSAFHPAAVLKGGPVVGAGGARVRQALVIAQFAVLIALGVSTLTIYRQTMFALTDATHTDKRNVVMMLARPCTDALRDAVAALPGVEKAACASPFGLGIADSENLVTVDGRKVSLSYAPVDVGFFGVYGIRPLAGRLFDKRPSDDGANHTDTAPPIVLNESAVRVLGFGSPQAAVGRLVAWYYLRDLSIGGMINNRSISKSSIIGVIPDYTLGPIHNKIFPTFYYVGAKTNVLSSVALNIKLDPSRIPQTLTAVDKVWDKISGGEPVLRYFADQFLLQYYIDTILQGAFIAVCALVAISIACLGLFALSAYTAERRTKEIGVRKAMGAGSGDILKLLLWQFTWPVLAANLIAWPVAFFAMRWWLEGFAYRVDLAPWTFVAAGAAAVVIALATTFAQGLRVSRSKPVAALRYE